MTDAALPWTFVPAVAVSPDACADVAVARVGALVWIVASISALAHAAYWVFSSERTVGMSTRVVALCFAVLFGPLYWIFWAGIHSRDLQ